MELTETLPSLDEDTWLMPLDWSGDPKPDHWLPPVDEPPEHPYPYPFGLP